MKTLKNIILLVVAAVLVATSMTSRAITPTYTSNEEGMYAKRIYKLSDFSSVHIYKGVELLIVPSDKNEAVITSSKEVLQKLEVTQNKDDLFIKLRRSRQGKVAITLYCRNVTAVYASNGCKILSNRETPIKSHSLEVIAKRKCDVNLNINVSELYCNLSQGATVTLSGSANNTVVDLKSKSQLLAKDLTTVNSDIRACYRSYAEINTKEKAKTCALFMSDVVYKEKPADQSGVFILHFPKSKNHKI